MTDAEKLKESVDKVLDLNKQHVDALLECIKQEDLKKHVDPLATKLQETLSKEMTKLEDEIQKLHDLEDAFSTLKQSQGYDSSGKKEEDSLKRKAALNRLLKEGLGMDGNRPLDLNYLKNEDKALFEKSLISGSNQDGGFMTINEMASQILMLEKDRSPIRSLAQVVTGSGPAWEQVVQTGRFGALRVGETAARPETDSGELQEQTISAEELYANPFVSQTMLDDTAFDLVGYLNGQIADEFAIKEGTESVLGNGVKQFRGFTTYPDGKGFGLLEQTETKNAGALAYEDFVDLDELILTGFADRKFLMNRNTRGKARKIVDGDSQPILLNRMANTPLSGLPTIFEHEVVEMPDMPNVGAGGSLNLSVAFGDFRRSYLIYDRTGIKVLRDPFTNKPFVLFYTTKRSGGDVINFQGIKLLRTK